MHDNVDRSLLSHWSDARERHAEEQRFLHGIERERGLRTVPAADDGSLFDDQLAALRERIERQRAALQLHYYPDDDDDLA
jgi:hypothetical protein